MFKYTSHPSWVCFLDGRRQKRMWVLISHLNLNGKHKKTLECQLLFNGF